ncbi:hypothetical protein QBC45DRAFT_10249 [Copromyces sp. CBS 386.78]|nr:hypothetical protein QBC45DRAFT_10249 [Copromyces sp. CBS 386.78]
MDIQEWSLFLPHSIFMLLVRLYGLSVCQQLFRHIFFASYMHSLMVDQISRVLTPESHQVIHSLALVIPTNPQLTRKRLLPGTLGNHNRLP